MKTKGHLQYLAGLGFLIAICHYCPSASAVIIEPPVGPDTITGVINGTQDASLSISRLNDRVPGIHWSEYVAPAETPHTDAKGALVKRGDSKDAKQVLAPVRCEERWEIFAAAYWYDEHVRAQYQPIPIKVGSLTPALAVPENDIEITGVNFGARYRINDEWSFGGMAGYSDADVEFRSLGTKFAKIDVETWSVSPSVNFQKKSLIANADFVAQLQYIYGSSQYDVRLLSPPFILPLGGSHGGDSNTVDLTTGLVWNNGNLHHGPVAGLRYTNVHVDSFDITGIPGTANVQGGSFDSLVSTLGYQVSYDIKVGGGKFVPTAYAAWEHEFEDDYVGKFTGGVPHVARDTAVVGAGIGWYGDCCGWNVLLGYEGRFNSESTSSFVGLKLGKSY
jgi:hypothetical protein